MPLYEYACKKCGHRFETLVARSGAEVPPCPNCGSEKPEKQFSTFAVGAKKTRSAPNPCDSCGDPRGPGACRLNG